MIYFRKLLILRALRPDKVTEAMQLFITDQLDAKFIEPPPFDLPLSFKPSTVRTPLIFVLSAGSDPMKDVLNFANTMKMSKRFHAISLGQGQGPRGKQPGLVWLVGGWFSVVLPSVGAVNCGRWHLLINFLIFSVTSDDNGGNRHAKR